MEKTNVTKFVKPLDESQEESEDDCQDVWCKFCQALIQTHS